MVPEKKTAQYKAKSSIADDKAIKKSKQTTEPRTRPTTAPEPPTEPIIKSQIAII